MITYQLAEDLFRRSQTRRRLAFEYLEWAREDAANGKIERATMYANTFRDLMHNARMDLYSLRAWGFKPNKAEPRRIAA